MRYPRLSLLGLPGEIRNTIFDYVFADDAFPAPFEDAFWGVVPVSQHWQLRVRLTCRQLNDEIAELVFSRTRFVVDSYNRPIGQRIRDLPKRLAFAITSIELASYFEDPDLSPNRTTAFFTLRRIKLRSCAAFIWESARALPVLREILFHGESRYWIPGPKRGIPGIENLDGVLERYITEKHPEALRNFECKPVLPRVSFWERPRLHHHAVKFGASGESLRELFVCLSGTKFENILQVRDAGIEIAHGYCRVRDFPYDNNKARLPITSSSVVDIRAQLVKTNREKFLWNVAALDDEAIEKLRKRMEPHRDEL